MKNCQAGFSVVEMVTASTILFVVLMAIITMMVYSSNTLQTTTHRDDAMNIANSQIEIARNLPYDSLGVVDGNPAGVIAPVQTHGMFTINTAVTWARDAVNGGRAMNKKITVTVAWNTPVNAQVTLTTSIIGKSNITGTGDLEIRTRYLASGEPVSGVSFTVGNTSDVTGSDGISFFGALPMGQYIIATVPPAGYIYDAVSLATQNVVVDSLTAVTVEFQKPSTVTYTVTDASTGVPLVGATLELVRNGNVVATKISNGSPLTFSNLVVGSYILNFSKPSYRSSSQQLLVDVEDSSQTAAITMSPMPTVGSIALTVLDANNANLNGAQVILRSSTGTQTVQYTSTNDVTTFLNIPPDNYTITVSYPGYTAQTFVQSLLGGESLNLSAKLSQTPAQYGALQVTTTLAGQKAKDIRIVISGDNYFNDTLVSDTDGRITVNSLPIGNYNVWTYSNPASSVPVSIAAGQTSGATVDRIK